MAGPSPEPDARWLPEGVDGPTLADDPSSFEWTDASFVAVPWAEAVVYELHLGTFSVSGTALGAIEHLDHLVSLGVTHVELMPLGTFGGRWGWGYDVVFWSAPHPSYGSPSDVRSLIDACHARGLAVIVDVVYNHLGPVGAASPSFETFLTDRHETPWGRAMNLDGPGSSVVRARILDDAAMWVTDYHADGLRLDAVHALVDDSPVHLLAVLRSLLPERVVLIAEDNRRDLVSVRPPSEGGYGLTAKWSDELHHAVHAFVTGERQGYYEPFGDPSLVGRELSSGGVTSVVSLQNHDQIGNRPYGERLHSTVSVEVVLAALPLFLLGPSVPMLFQGEEWAASAPFPYFADHHGDLAEAIRSGRAREFSWVVDEGGDPVPDALAESTFRSAVLAWDEVVAPAHARVLERYRELIALRRSNPAELCAGAPCEVRQEGSVVTIRRGRFTITCDLAPASPSAEITAG